MIFKHVKILILDNGEQSTEFAAFTFDEESLISIELVCLSSNEM